MINKFLRENKLDQYLSKKYLDYTLVAFSVLFGFYLRWDLENIAFFSFLIWIILNPISSHLLARVALYFLSFVPFLIIIKKADRAEQFAIFAYYFLVLVVVTRIIENKQKSNVNTQSMKIKR